MCECGLCEVVGDVDARTLLPLRQKLSYSDSERVYFRAFTYPTDQEIAALAGHIREGTLP